MTDVFKPSDPITGNNISELEAHYTKELSEVEEAIRRKPIRTIIGSSGTMQNIGMMIADLKNQSTSITLNELEFTADDFFSFYKKFIMLDRGQRKKISGLDSKRVDFINTGVVLVNLLLRRFDIEKVKVSTQALREGIIIRHLKKDMGDISIVEEIADPRRRSVFELLRKCNWHEKHSRHVAKLALILFNELQEDLALTEEDRELWNMPLISMI